MFDDAMILVMHKRFLRLAFFFSLFLSPQRHVRIQIGPSGTTLHTENIFCFLRTMSLVEVYTGMDLRMMIGMKHLMMTLVRPDCEVFVDVIIDFLFNHSGFI